MSELFNTLLTLHWLRPLWLLAIPPALLLFYWQWHTHSRQSQWQRVIDPALLTHLLNNSANVLAERKRALPVAACALATSIGLIALAGPAWEKLPQPPIKASSTVIVIADLTLSMHTQDIPPSRLTRMRFKLLELLARRDEGQTALIAYSGDAHLVSPLTDDAKTIAALVPSLSPEIMPSIGSNATAAFLLAETILKTTPDKARVVWFTDEVLNRDKADVSRIVSASGAELVIIGIGTATGGPIPLPNGKFLKNARGTIATAKLESSTLRNLATRSGGTYLNMRDDNSDIALALKTTATSELSLTSNNPLENDHAQETLVFDAWLDRGASLCFFILPVALCAFRRGWVLTCVLLLPLASLHPVATWADENAVSGPLSQLEASTTDDAGTPKQLPTSWHFKNLWQSPDQQAQKLWRDQQYEQAAELFKRDDWRGAAAFRGKQYETALAAFEQNLAAEKNAATTTDTGGLSKTAEAYTDASAEEKKKLAYAHYNFAHALARSGSLPEAIEQYTQALKLKEDFVAASEAKTIVEKLLQQSQSEQQDSSQDNPEDSADNSSQEPSDENSQSGKPTQNDSNEQDNAQDQTASDNEQSGDSNPAQNEDQESRSADFSGNSEEMAKPDEGEPDSAAEGANPPIDEQPKETEEGDQDAAAQQSRPTQQQLNEAEQVKLQQWLNKIEDDPGGLLRRKFQYERQVRERQGNVVDESKDGQLW